MNIILQSKMTETKIFRMTNFCPIGFKIKNYPIPHCPLCRGLLKEPCNICMEQHNEKCNVMLNNNIYYHEHCYNFINLPEKTNSKKPNNELDESDESA